MKNRYLFTFFITLIFFTGCVAMAPNMAEHSSCDKLYGYPIYKTKEADIALANSLSTLGKVYIRNFPKRQDVAILDFDVISGQPTKIVFRFGNETKLWEFSNFEHTKDTHITSSQRNTVTKTIHISAASISSVSLVVPMEFIKTAAAHNKYYSRVYFSSGYAEGENSGGYSLTSNSRDFIEMIKTNPCEK